MQGGNVLRFILIAIVILLVLRLLARRGKSPRMLDEVRAPDEISEPRGNLRAGDEEAERERRPPV
jgi:hypothetical protein